MFQFIKNKKDVCLYVILALGICFFYFVRTILPPFIISIVIAFLFKNLVRKLEKTGVNRNISSLLFVILSSLLIILAVIFVIPIIFTQSVSLVKELMNYFNKVDVNSILGKLNQIGISADDTSIKNNILLIYQHGIKYLGNLSNFLLSKSIYVVGKIVNLFVIPIITFYILRDWDKIFVSLTNLIPKEYRSTFIKLSIRTNNVLEAFLVGQFSVCFILGLFYSVMLYFAGLKYGLLIGMLGGIFTIVPYLGCFCGCVVAIVASIFQCNGVDFMNITLVLSIFAVGQFLEGNFITPKLIGEKVNLHPLWVIFALFAGGCLGGMTGIFFSLPIAGVVGTILRYYLKRNK